jgi:O-antigen biosynthesis protein
VQGFQWGYQAVCGPLGPQGGSGFGAHPVAGQQGYWVPAAANCLASPRGPQGAPGPQGALGPEGYPGASLFYSHAAQVLADGGRDDSRFDAGSGWEYREAVVDGRDVLHPVALAPTPHNVSYIWFAPSHVRAFPRAAYERAGGYDAARKVLDDQDLMGRLYRLGGFHLIDDCLYLQRMHEVNTQRDAETNAFIQTETVALYDRCIEGNALAWAAREGLLALDLGAAHNKPDGYLGVDQRPGPGVDIVARLPERLVTAEGWRGNPALRYAYQVDRQSRS